MRSSSLVVLVLVALTGALPAAEPTGSRAWQQRLDLEMPLRLPLLALEPDNPFAVPVEVAPQRREATPPRRVEVAGSAVVAAYVDVRGSCPGGVPLEIPFPGLGAALVAGLSEARFDPARVGNETQPSWVVLELQVEGTVRESGLVSERLELPDPLRPPEPAPPMELTAPVQLASLPFARAETVTSAASPRRVSVKAPSREAEVPVRALVRVSAAGRCDRYVPLELDSGLAAWLEAYLASWVLDPAQRDGAPVEAWVLYTARVRLKMSSLSSGSYRVLRDRTYAPTR